MEDAGKTPPGLTLRRSTSISRLLARTGSESAHKWFSALLKTPSVMHRNYTMLDEYAPSTPDATQLTDPAGMAGSEQEMMYGQSMGELAPLLQSFRTDPSHDRFGFALEFCQEDLSCAKSAKWSYSAILRQLFVNMNNVCPITLSTREAVPEGCILRATLQYTQAAHKAKPVLRCPTHLAQHEKGDPVPAGHVLRCDNAQSVYELSRTGLHSVVIPVTVSKETGTLQQTELFKMMCFSSCTGGINRRPVDIVFTLEQGGAVLCTQSVSIRVCACPGRDRKAIERASAATVLTTIKRSNSNGGPGAAGTSTTTTTTAAAAAAAPRVDEMDLGDDSSDGFRAPAKRKAAGSEAVAAAAAAAAGSSGSSASSSPSSQARTLASGVKQIVTTIDKQLPFEEDDMREYIIQVRGYDNFLMVSKVVDALHDAQSKMLVSNGKAAADAAADADGNPAKKKKARLDGDEADGDDGGLSAEKRASIKDVGSWARAFGLGKHEKTLLDAGFDDLELVEAITAQDLEKLGVGAGERDAVLKAARQLAAIPEIHKHNMLRTHQPQHVDAKFTRLVVIKRQPSQAPKK